MAGRDARWHTAPVAILLAVLAVAQAGSAEPPQYDDHAKLLVYRDADGKLRPVETPSDWALRREHVRAAMQRVMGRLPRRSQRVSLDVKTLDEHRTPHYTRIKLTYAAEPGDRVPALLLLPHQRVGKVPGVLCLHPTSPLGKGLPAGLGGKLSRHYAHELAVEGFVCLVPDYPSFGDYDYDFKRYRDRYPSGSLKAVWNNLRAVDLLQQRAEVDPERIGCIGHSLGGHNAIFTAVFDRRIRAVVSSCGFTAFEDYYGGDLTGWTSDRYMPRIRDRFGSDPKRMPFDFHELIAALAPRAVFVNAPLHDDNFPVVGVKKVMAAAGKVYELHDVANRLTVVYPDCGHDFPESVRKDAYRWLRRQLD